MGRTPEYEPTPEQIRAECLKIQEEWSEEERLKRAGVNIVTKAVIKEAGIVLDDPVLHLEVERVMSVLS